MNKKRLDLRVVLAGLLKWLAGQDTMTEELRIEETLETAEEITARQGIYGAIRQKLIALGIPAHEIAFIHDFDTPVKKSALFREVNAGRVRILIGSTEKMGTGMNVQERLCALHHLDPPWRPSDIEQREGRILRQGNIFPEVHIFQYVSESSFDGYMWQGLESKARFISQIMAGQVTARTAEDVDQLVMTAAQIKALASGNPQVMQKVGLEIELTKLERLYAAWVNSRHRMRQDVVMLPQDLRDLEREITAHTAALSVREACRPTEGTETETKFQMSLKLRPDLTETVTLSKREQAGAHLRQLAYLASREALSSGSIIKEVGSYRGFTIYVQLAATFDSLKGAARSLFAEPQICLKLAATNPGYYSNLTESDAGIVQSIDAQLRNIEKRLENAERAHGQLSRRLAGAQEELAKGWEHAEKYQEMKERLDALNRTLTGTGEEIENSPEFSELVGEALLPAPAPLSTTTQIAALEAAAPTNESSTFATLAPPVETDQLIVAEAAESVHVAAAETADVSTLVQVIQSAHAVPETLVSGESVMINEITEITESGTTGDPVQQAQAATHWETLLSMRTQAASRRTKRQHRPAATLVPEPQVAQLDFGWS